MESVAAGEYGGGGMFKGLRPAPNELLMPPYTGEGAPSVGWQWLPRMEAAEPVMQIQREFIASNYIFKQSKCI